MAFAGNLLCLGTLWGAAGLGTVNGIVKFPGETPPRNMFANASDPACPRGIPQTHLLVRQENLGLQNALVFLDRRDRRVMPTRLGVELAATECRLKPRVQWVPLGTSLLLVNKDQTLHHLHAYKGKNTLFEVDLRPGEPPVRRPLVVPGLVRIDCDRHLWERAWIYASPHDSVGVTDDKGEFEIKNVPKGQYAVTVWHEGWLETGKDREGRMRFQPMGQFGTLRVKDGQTTRVLFDHLSPNIATAPKN